MTQDATTSYEDAYKEYYMDAMTNPMPWFQMDSDFMRDTKIRKLAIYGGYDYIGKYVAFIACLAACDNHIYDVSDEIGWRFLLSDMSVVGCEFDEDDLKEFVGVLLKLQLIDAELYDESMKIASPRMLRNVEDYAKSVAGAKAKAFKMRQGKAAGR